MQLKHNVWLGSGHRKILGYQVSFTSRSPYTGTYVLGSRDMKECISHKPTAILGLASKAKSFEKNSTCFDYLDESEKRL